MSRRLYYSIRMRASLDGRHISGAEGIYRADEIASIVRQYSERALRHQKGRAEEIRLAVDRLQETPRRISSLPMCTLNTKNPKDALRSAEAILSAVGISERAVDEAFRTLSSGITMRGAMLMNLDGVRLEPDLFRGVRVTRMGLTKAASSDLSRKLSRLGLNNDTVKEALVLASKVHSYRMVLGEICISDDPGYTTGYVAGRSFGYVRLPRIKKRGTQCGGRAFFITGGEVAELIKYLQSTPVLISSIKPCSGVVTLREILEGKTRR